MVCKTKLSVLFLLICCFIVVGCEKAEIEQSDRKMTAEEEEKMNNLNITETIADILKCDERIAASIEKQCGLAGIKQVSEIEEQKSDVYTILKLSTEEGVDYFVFLGDGYFLEQIREKDLDGKIIYKVME